MDAKHFWQWEDAGLGKWNGPFEPFFDEAAAKANRIHFDLSEMDIERASSTSIDFNLGKNVTNSALNTILKTPLLLEKTTFYRNGVIVPPPK